MQYLEQTIRERAYHLWQSEGCPAGHADAHWLAAQREILAASLEGVIAVSAAAPKKAAKKPAAKKKRAA